jgi:hypothetical protein
MKSSTSTHVSVSFVSYKTVYHYTSGRPERTGKAWGHMQITRAHVASRGWEQQVLHIMGVYVASEQIFICVLFYTDDEDHKQWPRY